MTQPEIRLICFHCPASWQRQVPSCQEQADVTSHILVFLAPGIFSTDGIRQRRV